MPTRPRWSSRLALALLAPAATLLALEGLCRAVGVRPAAVQRPFLDFQLGWSFVPAETEPYFERHPTRFFQPKPFRRGVARTDEHGFRGGEHPPRHDNLLRVALIGDSTTFGFGVRYGQSFAGLLEQRLRRALPALDVDVVNAGCYAYSTYQNLRDLEERVLPLAPDAVVLCLSGYNDGVGAVGFDDATWGSWSPARLGPLAPLLAESRLAGAISALLEPARRRALGDPEAARRAVEERAAPNGRRVPFDAYEHNVRALIERSRAGGAEVFCYAHPHPAAELAKDGERRRYTELTRALAAALAVPLLDGERCLDPADPSLFYDGTHPTEAGHARVAAGLAELLLAAPRIRARARGAAAAAAPALEAAAAEGEAPYAAGGGLLLVRGRNLDRGLAPRFFLAGDPVDLAEPPAGDRALLRLPPLAPGAALLEVQTRHGSARLQQPLLLRGPELSVATAGGRAAARIAAPPGHRYRLLIASEAEEKPVMLGRVLGLRVGSILPGAIEGEMPDGGALELDVPLPAGGLPRLFLQAFVEPAAGDEPRVPLLTQRVQVGS